MLRFFRYNDPYRLLTVLLVLLIISLPLFISPAGITWQELRDMVLGEALQMGNSIYTSVIDDTAPVYAWVDKWMYFLFGRSLQARHLLAFILFLFQVSYFAILLINHKAYNENTYLPALLFGTLGLFSFDMLSLSPELLASTILLFALNNLFREIEFREQRNQLIINLGFFIGLTSLVLFSCFIFLFGTLAILFLFTRLTLRKVLLFLFSFILPHLMLFFFFFSKNNQGYLIDYFYVPNFTFHTEHIVSTKSLLWLTAVPMFYLVFSLIMLTREAHFTKHQSQLLQVMMVWLVIVFIHLIITRERTPHSFYFFLPPLTYLINHFLLLIRRKWIAEIMLWLLVVAVISISLQSKLGLVKTVNYEKLFARVLASMPIKGKRILLLQKNEGYFLENASISAYPNWTLSKNIFEHPAYFENVSHIERSFTNDPPEVIIDELNLMKPFFDRLPTWRKQYRRDGNYYIQVSN